MIVLRPSIVMSEVPGHQGRAAFIWRNRNFWLQRGDGGTTGYFKQVRALIPGLLYRTVGAEFHGVVEDGGSVVLPTLFRYGAEYRYPDRYAGPRVRRDAKRVAHVDFACAA